MLQVVQFVLLLLLKVDLFGLWVCGLESADRVLLKEFVFIVPLVGFSVFDRFLVDLF